MNHISREAEFAARIDACFPYDDKQKAEELIQEAASISSRATMHVVWELVCPPLGNSAGAEARAGLLERVKATAPPVLQEVVGRAIEFLRAIRTPLADVVRLQERVAEMQWDPTALAMLTHIVEPGSENAAEANEERILAEWKRSLE